MKMSQNTFCFHSSIIKSLTFFVLITSFSNCLSTEADKKNRKIIHTQAELLEAIKGLDTTYSPVGKQIYLVLPNQGCEGCISVAENFVIQHYKTDQHIKYIFTKIVSKKLLRIKLSDSVMYSSQVILDSTNLIKYPEFNKTIYPMIVYIENNTINHLNYQSPEDDGIMKMEAYMKK